MLITSKSLVLSAGLVALVACRPEVLAQSPQGPAQVAPQIQRNDTASPMRDFQQMIEAQKAQMHNRIAAAARRVQTACRQELQSFCSTVTPGEGRLLLCMQAHEDKLGNQCELALLDASRNIHEVVSRVEHIADACLADIQTHCAAGGSVAQCMSEKRALFSPRCQAVLADLQPAPQQGTQRQPTLTGLPIYSSDGMKVGEVVGTKTGLDGRPQLIKAEIGSLLGLGTSTVLITPDEIEPRADGLQLQMPAEQIRAVLQAQR